MISHFFAGECTERGRPVKALRFAPTATRRKERRVANPSARHRSEHLHDWNSRGCRIFSAASAEKVRVLTLRFRLSTFCAASPAHCLRLSVNFVLDHCDGRYLVPKMGIDALRRVMLTHTCP